jgi:hypothetical protein
MKSTRTQSSQINLLLAIIALDAHDHRVREIERKYAHVPPYEPTPPTSGSIEVYMNHQTGEVMEMHKCAHEPPYEPTPLADPQPEWALFGNRVAICGNLPVSQKRKKRYTDADYARNPYIGFSHNAQIWLRMLKGGRSKVWSNDRYDIHTGRSLKRDLRRLEQRGSIIVDWERLTWRPKFAKPTNNS